MGEIIKWIAGIFLVSLTNLNILPAKMLHTQGPVDCVLNGVKTTAINQAKCDEWVNYLKTLPSPTAKINNQTVVNNNPSSGGKIDCIGPDGKHLQITQQECDNFNAAWGKSKSTNQTNGGNQGQNNQVRIPTYTSTYVDNSITCIVSYSCTGASYTYRLLPADCTSAQQEARNLCNNSNNNNSNSAPIATPTFTESQAQSIIDQHNSQVQQCRSNVANQYSSLIQGCNIRFGASSAAEACVSIYERDRQNAYNACGTIY